MKLNGQHNISLVQNNQHNSFVITEESLKASSTAETTSPVEVTEVRPAGRNRVSTFNPEYDAGLSKASSVQDASPSGIAHRSETPARQQHTTKTPPANVSTQNITPDETYTFTQASTAEVSAPVWHGYTPNFTPTTVEIPTFKNFLDRVYEPMTQTQSTQAPAPTTAPRADVNDYSSWWGGTGYNNANAFDLSQAVGALPPPPQQPAPVSATPAPQSIAMDEPSAPEAPTGPSLPPVLPGTEAGATTGEANGLNLPTNDPKVIDAFNAIMQSDQSQTAIDAIMAQMDLDDQQAEELSSCFIHAGMNSMVHALRNEDPNGRLREVVNRTIQFDPRSGSFNFNWANGLQSNVTRQEMDEWVATRYNGDDRRMNPLSLAAEIAWFEHRPTEISIGGFVHDFYRDMFGMNADFVHVNQQPEVLDFAKQPGVVTSVSGLSSVDTIHAWSLDWDVQNNSWNIINSDIDGGFNRLPQTANRAKFSLTDAQLRNALLNDATSYISYFVIPE